MTIRAAPDLRYLPLDTIEREVMADLLDAETRRLTCGPGMIADDPDYLLDMFSLRLGTIDRHAVMMGDRLVGILEFCRHRPRTRIGFCVHRDVRGMGVFSKAWSDLHARYGPRFEALTQFDNAAGRRALRSIGFTERDPIVFEDRLVSVAVMDLDPGST